MTMILMMAAALPTPQTAPVAAAAQAATATGLQTGQQPQTTPQQSGAQQPGAQPEREREPSGGAGGAAEEEGAGEDIVVTGSRPRGSVVGDIPPDQTLGAADVRSYGVSSISDLLTELAPQTTSGRGGAPVTLLNGKRISGFQEIRDIPTEAIERVEILPEEVALKYGYRADSRVVNIVLRRRFRAATVEADARLSTEGGRTAPEGELDLLSIQRDGRANLHLEYSEASALLESQRNISAASNDEGTANFDQRAYRTLLPQTRNFEANAVYATPLLGTSATFNGTLELADTTGQFGLPVVTLPGDVVRRLEDGFSPLTQRGSTLTGHLGTTLNGGLGQWQWSFTGNYDRVESDTRTETGVDASGFAGDPNGTLVASQFGVLPANRARSTSSTGGGDLLLTGSLFDLPAGEVTTSVRVGASTSDFSSRSFRNATNSLGDVSRDIVNGQVNIDLPIASRSRDILSPLGQLSANLNVGVDHLSDFGTLLTTGYGANWSPIDGVRLIASATDEESAPSAQQLGNPTITTPNVRVFDYVRGTTATVTTISGGNPLLDGFERHVKKVGLTLKPWSARDLSLTANYVDTRVDNPVASFPAATAAIEAAFPDRFVRDADGELIGIDTRPVNFARTEQSQLRWGVNFSMPLKSKIQKQLEAFRAGTGPNPFEGLRPPGGGRTPGGEGPGAGGPGAGGPGAGGQRGPGGFGGGPGGGRFGGRGGGGGRLNFAVYHTWRFTDRVLVAEGGPSLDLLNGDAIGSSGGQSRHQLEGQAGYSNNGLGARLSVNYRTGTTVNGLTSAQDLDFGGLATADLRLFADFGGRLDWVRAHPWLRGVRVTAGISNLFNTRQRVTDATGATPITYQPDYLDPLGRSVRVSIRKLFF